MIDRPEQSRKPKNLRRRGLRKNPDWTEPFKGLRRSDPVEQSSPAFRNAQDLAGTLDLHTNIAGARSILEGFKGLSPSTPEDIAFIKSRIDTARNRFRQAIQELNYPLTEADRRLLED